MHLLLSETIFSPLLLRMAETCGEIVDLFWNDPIPDKYDNIHFLQRS
jgi:hypothetical protein